MALFRLNAESAKNHAKKMKKVRQIYGVIKKMSIFAVHFDNGTTSKSLILRTKRRKNAYYSTVST